MTKDRQKIASDGLSTDYYVLPESRELYKVIEFKNMTKGIAYIFQTCYTMASMDRDGKLITLINIRNIAESVVNNYIIKK